jgi:hypothetical protein
MPPHELEPAPLKLIAAPAIKRARRKPYPYKLTAGQHAEMYGKTKRNVAWYIEQGRDAEGGENLPPLDHPALMPGWWGQVMTQRCPDGILAAAARAEAGGAGELSVDLKRFPDSGAEQPTRGAGAVHSPRSDTSSGDAIADFEVRFADVLRQRDRAYLALTLEQSAEEPDAGRINSRMKEWKDLEELAAKAEADVVKKRAEAGRYIDKDELGSVIGPIVSEIGARIRVLYHRLRDRLRSADDEGQADIIWQAGLDEVFGELNKTHFGPLFQLMS